MVQKQERLYIPAYDPDYDIYCAKNKSEREERHIEMSWLNRRFKNLVAVFKLEEVTPENVEEVLLSEGEKRIFIEMSCLSFIPPVLSPKIPLENNRLVLKRPSLDHYLAAARTILEFKPQVNDWLYEESPRRYNYRKKSYEDYTPFNSTDFKEELSIPPLIFFKFDYQTLFFPQNDGVVMGLAKIGKAGSYESRRVARRSNFGDHYSSNEIMPDMFDYYRYDPWGDEVIIGGSIPIYALILTAQSSQDLDTLEERLGLR